MKRILGYLLAVVLCLTAVIAEGEEAEWKYDKLWGYVSGYSGSGGDVVVPSEVDGNAVRVIQSSGLNRRDDITSFTVPEGVIALGEQVMTTMTNLTSVSLPGTLQVIGDHCFTRCESLTEVTVPASVRFIGLNAFGDCSALKTITFEGPCPVFKKGEVFLKYNPKDAVIYVPDDQLEAYRAAMPAVSGQIQPSGKNAQPQPELHAEFTMDPETGTLTRCTSEDTWIEVPAEIDGVQVKSIGKRAFSSNTFCYAVILPEGLEEIGPEAFGGLSRLTYAPIPSTVRTIGEEAYAYYNGFQLTLPAGLTEIAPKAFTGNVLDMELTIPEGVTSIGDEAFRSSNIYAVNMPSTLVSIGSKAFEGWMIEDLYFDTLTLPEIAEDAFENQGRDITVSLPPAAGEAEVAAAQAFLDTIEGSFTVVRLDEANGIYPNSPYSQPAVTEVPVTEAPEATEEPAGTVTETPAPEATMEPANGPSPVSPPDLEGVSMNPDDYVGTWYMVYVGTGGFTGDPRPQGWQDILILNADGSVGGTFGDDFTSWGVEPESGMICLYDAWVGVVLLPDGFLQYNNRISGYCIFSKDPNAVWDPDTPMYEDLWAAAVNANATPTPEPTAPPAVPVSGEKPAAGDGSIALDTKYVCVRYTAAGYEMDASILGAELSAVLHSDGSLEFIMIGSEVTGLTWTWDGNDAVVDYYGAGQLRFTPGEDGTVLLDFMGTMTYILAIP